jgi:iron(III) transport system ATP-binding protein
MVKLAIRGLGRDFGGVAAVRDFTLDVATGEFVSLLGPSGCGKTTMLRMIAGFVPPSRGTIELNGRVVSSPASCLPPERRSMSMIFQSYAIWPNMTVFENVAFGLRLRRLARADIDRQVREMLDVVRLSELGGRYPAELSGGQQQRVALARAIVIRPEVLLLDEPLSNLDANLRDEMRLEIRRLHDRVGTTTIYVTHDQAEAMVTSDRIVVMNGGRIEQVDTPYRLYNAPRTRFVASFIGRTNFLRGKRTATAVDFGGFSLPAAALAEAERVPAEPLFSVRPQSIDLARQPPAERRGARHWIAARVGQRAYFGDRWDYTVDAGGVSLVVSREPREQFERGEAVWIGLDPAQMALITELETPAPGA